MICFRLFLTVQQNSQGLYGYNVENASKASSLDLVGCAAVFAAQLSDISQRRGTQVRDGGLLSERQLDEQLQEVLKKVNDSIHVPLMAVISYRGFRLTAMSVLPIDGKTLIYGLYGIEFSLLLLVA